MRSLAVGASCGSILLALVASACTDRADQADHDAAVDANEPSRCDGQTGGVGDCSSPPSACEGEAPALESCFVGLFFADCGGGGEPRLACASTEDDCRWFTSSCTPAGYVASDCPADAICCHDNYPYAPGSDFTWHVQMAGLSDRLSRYGTQPWDRERMMALAVDVDPALVPSPFECRGVLPPSNPSSSPCQGVTGFWRAGSGTIQLHLGGVPEWNWVVWSEVDPGADAGPVGRVCWGYPNDAYGSLCPPSDRIECATAGVLRLSALPAAGSTLAALRFEVEATFASGLELVGGFDLGPGVP